MVDTKRTLSGVMVAPASLDKTPFAFDIQSDEEIVLDDAQGGGAEPKAKS